ncbi:hypothetical protein EDF73_103284 [Raoultella sp. BIGb0138]|nr:hypothetical protein EDF73_103284 [Raoultella sp. BIGb0138]
MDRFSKSSSSNSSTSSNQRWPRCSPGWSETAWLSERLTRTIGDPVVLNYRLQPDSACRKQNRYLQRSPKRRFGDLVLMSARPCFPPCAVLPLTWERCGLSIPQRRRRSQTRIPEHRHSGDQPRPEVSAYSYADTINFDANHRGNPFLLYPLGDPHALCNVQTDALR